MVKLLRKYNKYILVVGGSLLMIAFIMPQAVNELFGDQSKRAYAHLGDTKLTYAEFASYDHDYQAVDKFAPYLTRGVLGVENVNHWMLLVKQAEAGGFIGDAGDGIDWPLLPAVFARAMAQQQYGQYANFALQQPQIAQQLMQQAQENLPRMREQSFRGSGLTEAQFDAAIAKARGIKRMMDTFETAARLSDIRAIAATKSQYDHTIGDALVIPADRLVSTILEPTEVEIQEHFGKYREAAPAAAEFGIGYRLPPRVKLEWLALDRSAIAAAIDVDPIDANKRWRSARGKYLGEFAAEQANVEADIKNEKVDQVVGEADKLIRNELKKAVARLESDKGYRKLPDGWANSRPKLEDIAALVSKAVRESTGIAMPLPGVTVKAAKWLTQSDLSQLEKIGQSTYRVGTKSVPFTQVVFESKELRTPESIAAGQDSGSGVQNLVTSGEVVLIDSQNDRFYFTILDSRVESPADSIEDVRDVVVANVKKIKAYEILKGEIERYRGVAAAEGMDKLAALIDTEHPAAVPPTPTEGPNAGKAPEVPKLTVQRRMEFYPTQSRNGGPALDNAPLLAEVAKVGATLDPLKPADQLPPETRTIAIGVPAALSLSVVQITARRPVTSEEMRNGGEGAIQQVRGAEIRKALETEKDANPFAFKPLALRMQFKPEKNDEDSGLPESPAPVEKAGA